MAGARKKTKEPELQGELEALRAALRDAEERVSLMLDAFRSGGQSPVGWWQWRISDGMVEASPDVAEIFGMDPKAGSSGIPVEDYLNALDPNDRERVSRRLQESLVPGGKFAEEFRLLRPHDAVVWIAAYARCHVDGNGQPVRLRGITLDITQQKGTELRKSALLTLGDRLRETDDIEGIALAAAEVMAGVLGASRAGFGVVDEARETVMLQPDWRSPGVASLQGLHRFRDYGSFIDDLKRGDIVVIGDVTTDSRTRDHAEALLNIGIRVLVNVPIREHGRFDLVLFVHHDRPHAWTEWELTFVRTVADRTQAAIARARAEERRTVLLRELGHRLKNNLAMTQSIVQLTLRNAPDVETALTTLGDRLATLGRAHDLLISSPANVADLRSVFANALVGLEGRDGRINVAGPNLELDSPASLALAMVLHELVTNAVKYGALSVPDGVVDVHWRVDEVEAAPTLHLTWRERNGPPVEPPKRVSLGTRLIRQTVRTDLGGEVDLDYSREGLTCTITAPLARNSPGA